MNSYFITSETEGTPSKTYLCSQDAYGFQIIEEIANELNVEYNQYLGLLNESENDKNNKWINLDLPIRVQEIQANSILRLIPRTQNLDLLKRADSGDPIAQYEYGTILEKENQLAEAVFYYKSSALQNYPPSLCKYGYYLYTGILVLKDQEYGRKLIISSAQSGFTEGQFRAGIILESEGFISESTQYYKKAADSGHIESQFRYASLISNSNSEESLKYMKSAADSGHLEAQFRCGTGLLSSDKTQAQAYLLKAAEAGHPIAQIRYAIYLDSKDSLEWIKKAVKNSNPQACYEYAQFLLNLQQNIKDNTNKISGKITDYIYNPEESVESIESVESEEQKQKEETDEKKLENVAIYFLTISANQSYVPAQVKLGQLLFSTNINQSIIYLKSAALKGNPIALWMYGDQLIKGKIVKKNIPEGSAMIKSSADQKNIDGLYLYGCLLEKGIGQGRDIEEAKKVFLCASKMGHPPSMCSYGNILITEEKYEEAIKFFKDAISYKESQAYYHLGRCYMRGTGVKIDYKEAKSNYEEAYKLGDSYGAFGLGVIYQRGYGVPVDFSLAEKYYNEAIKKDNTAAMNNLAVLQNFLINPSLICLPSNGYNPKEISKEQKQEIEKKAFALFKRAADLGDAFAAGNLGVFYENGQGTSKDLKEAANYYQKASDDGISWAIYNLAELIEKGNGVPKDLVKAAQLYEKAYNKGEIDALAKLGSFAIFGLDGREADLKKGMEMLELANQKKSPEAAYILGMLYLAGEKVPKDLEKAEAFLSQAASSDHQTAKKELEKLLQNKK